MINLLCPLMIFVQRTSFKTNGLFKLTSMLLVANPPAILPFLRLFFKLTYRFVVWDNNSKIHGAVQLYPLQPLLID